MTLIHDLNPQQAAAVQAMHGPVLVLAGPGSGKTRVLTRRITHMIEEAGIAPWNILAVTFTNKAAREMGERVEGLLADRFGEPLPGQPRRLGGLTIGTFHSICARVLRVETERIGFERNWVIYDTADQLALVRALMCEMNFDEKRYSPRAILSRISSQKNELITPDAYEAAGYFEEIAGRVYTRYQDALRANNAMDFDDLLMRTTLLLRRDEEIRVKYQQKWQYLLVDEFQDTNTAQYELLAALAGAPSNNRNLFVVGDEDQCVVAGTLIATPDGARPVEELVAESDQIVAASGHGAAAHSTVERRMVRDYDGDVVVVRTEKGRELRATPEHCVFGRFEPRGPYRYVYLMYSADLGYRIGRTEATRTSGEKAYPGFKERLRQERGDAIWLLKACIDAAEAAYWEAYLAAQYGLPTACFYAGDRRLAMGDAQIKQLFHELDTEAAAARLARDLGLSLAHPHHAPQATIRGGSTRKTISFRMFGSARRRTGGTRWQQGQDPWHIHEISICSSDPAFRTQVETVLSTKPHKHVYWAARRTNGDYDAMHQTLRKLRRAAPDSRVWQRARLTAADFDFMPIGNLIPGALVPVLTEDGAIGEEMVTSVERAHYTGPVYDLSVPTYRNYIANGIVVHNSIYRFRGADYRNVMRFREEYPDAKVILLEQNYRSTQTILDVANAVIANNRLRTPKKLHTENGKGLAVTLYEGYNEVEEAAYVCDEITRLVGSRAFDFGDFAIMYRTNAQSRALEEAFVHRNMKYKLVGATRFYERKEIKDALAFLRVVHNPLDTVALERIINVPARGIGAKTYAALQDWARMTGVSEYTALRILHHGPETVSLETGAILPDAAYTSPLGTRAQNALVGFSALLEHWVEENRQGHYASVAELLDAILHDSGYTDALRDGTDEGEERFENLQELRGVAAQYMRGMPGLDSAVDPDGNPVQTPLSLFLEEVSLVSDADEVDEGSGAVTLMTLHTAKGAGVSRGLHGRHGGRHSAPQPQPGKRRSRGYGRRASAGLRGHHAGQEAALSGPRSGAAFGAAANCRSPAASWTKSPANCSAAWSTNSRAASRASIA
ncbi:MAG: UvrD-helicase domain-containing protein [Caldilineaceae bacterium]